MASLMGYTEQAAALTDFEIFRKQLSRLSIVDVCKIMSVDKFKKARVQTFDYKAGDFVYYDSVELLSLGNSLVSIETEPTDSFGLLLAPRTPVKELALAKPSVEILPYETTGLKVLPLSTGLATAVSLVAGSDGRLHIKGTDIDLQVGESSLLIKSADKGNIQIDNQGNLSMSWFSDFIQKGIDKEGNQYSIQYGPDNKCMYYEMVAPDGKRVIKRNSFEAFTKDDELDIESYAKWQWVEVYDIDGTHAITLFDTDGTTELWKQVHDPDGTIATTTKAPQNITTDDAYSITAKGDVSVISKEGAISIEAKASKLVTIKNSVDSLGKLITDFLDLVNDFSQYVQAIDTVGSPGAHSAGPGIIGNMQNLQGQISGLKTKVGQVLG